MAYYYMFDEGGDDEPVLLLQRYENDTFELIKRFSGEDAVILNEFISGREEDLIRIFRGNR